MSKRKPMDKTQLRERRDRLLESAAAANLSLTEGVREMRAIAGMTQEEFARHRGVSARVIKAIELGQGNPTVATMNRIAQFFGLEVGLVPVRRATQAGADLMDTKSNDANEAREDGVAGMRKLAEKLVEMDAQLQLIAQGQKTLAGMIGAPLEPAPLKRRLPEDTAAGATGTRTKRKPRSP